MSGENQPDLLSHLVEDRQSLGTTRPLLDLPLRIHLPPKLTPTPTTNTNHHYQPYTTTLYYNHDTEQNSIPHTSSNRSPISQRTHARTTTAAPAQLGQTSSEKLEKKSAAPPMLPLFMYLVTSHIITNTTLAGVAQSVERVALMTAKRSTSRSWVRAPPSAIPISKLSRAAVLFAFCFGRFLDRSWECTHVYGESGIMLARGEKRL